MSLFEWAKVAQGSLVLVTVVTAACETKSPPGDTADESPGGSSASAPTPGSGGAPDPALPATGGGRATGGESNVPPDNDVVPLFVAQGHLGRTLVSCDRGQTWVENPSVRPEYDGKITTEIRCFENDFNCDHVGSPGRGLAYGNGEFFATFGWGEADGVYSSKDGGDFRKVLDGTTFGGLAYVKGNLIGGARMSRYSTDGGTSWSEPQDTGLAGWNVRRVGQSAEGGGLAILVGEAGEAVLSEDGGKTWKTPKTFPSGCGKDIQSSGGIEGVEGVLLIVGGDGSVCRSTDGGDTFSYSTLESGASSHLTHDGQKFVVYGGGKRYSSTDGETWDSKAISPEGLNLGAIVSDGKGRIAGVNGGWMVWYEKQSFYYSDDGLNFTEATAAGGHPITDMVFGSAERPEACQ